MPIAIVGTPAFNRYTQNWSVTVPGGANLALGSMFVPAAGVFGATLNGDAMTMVRRQPNNDVDWRNALLRRFNPASGNFVRTLDGTPQSDCSSIFFCVEGADIAGGAIRAVNGVEDANATVSITIASEPGDLVVATVWEFAGGAASGGDLVAQGVFDGSNRGYLLARIATGTSTTLTTAIGSSSYWIAVGASIAPEAGGSGPDPLTAQSGAISIGGSAATLRFDRRLGAQAAAITLSGTPASLEYHRALVAQAGATTITGGSATLRLRRRVAAQPGAVSLAGTSAQLARGLVLSASAGAVTLTGTTATLRRRYDLAAAAGAIALSGATAQLRRTFVLASSAGAVTLTGTDATLTLQQGGGPEALVCSPGAVQLTGSAAALRAERRLTALTAPIAITGTSATLRRRLALDVLAGALTITGAASTLRADRRLTAQGGTLTIVGTAATLRRQRALEALAGALAITGAASTLRWDRRLTAQGGTLTIVGTAAGLSWSAELQPLPLVGPYRAAVLLPGAVGSLVGPRAIASLKPPSARGSLVT